MVTQSLTILQSYVSVRSMDVPVTVEYHAARGSATDTEGVKDSKSTFDPRDETVSVLRD